MSPTDDRKCTCHPDDNPPQPCPKQFALGECRRVADLAEAEEPVVNIGPEWKPCVKLPITVHVREQRPGESHISTREGITPVKPDDLIMRGVAGEEYPIGRELFKRTYRMGAEAEEPVAARHADRKTTERVYARSTVEIALEAVKKEAR